MQQQFVFLTPYMDNVVYTTNKNKSHFGKVLAVETNINKWAEYYRNLSHKVIYLLCNDLLGSSITFWWYWIEIPAWSCWLLKIMEKGKEAEKNKEDNYTD